MLPPIGKIGVALAAVVAGVSAACQKEVSSYAPCKADQIDPLIRYGQLRQLVQGGYGCGRPLGERSCVFLFGEEPILEHCRPNYENALCDPDTPNYAFMNNGNFEIVINDSSRTSRDDDIARHERAHELMRQQAIQFDVSLFDLAEEIVHSPYHLYYNNVTQECVDDLQPSEFESEPSVVEDFARIFGQQTRQIR